MQHKLAGFRIMDKRNLAAQPRICVTISVTLMSPLQSAKEIWILFTQKFADLCQHAVQSGKRGPSFSKLIDSSSGTGIHDNQIKASPNLNFKVFDIWFPLLKP